MNIDYDHKTTEVLNTDISSLLHDVRGYSKTMIFGAGESGEWVRSILERENVFPVCYIDNYPPKQGTTKRGLPILAFKDAAAKNPDACICIGSLWAENIIEQIAEHDSDLLKKTFDFTGAMVWEIKNRIYRSTEITYIKDHTDLFEEAYRNFADEKSQTTLEGILNYRITRNAAYIKSIVCHGDEYFDDEIIPKEIFLRDKKFPCEIIDGGAFDGDTAKRFLEHFGAFRFVIHCYEPDHKNAEHIDQYKNKLKSNDIIVHECGLYDSSKKTKVFLGNGLGGGTVESNLDNQQGQSIEIEAIDDTEWNNLCFIKLDIEGAERYALKGGINTIRLYRPVLAVCAYHLQDDIIQLTQFMLQLQDYKIFLRHYMNAASETILYGIPAEYDTRNDK